MAAASPSAAYACINLEDVSVPQEIAGRSVCIRSDIGLVLSLLC